MLPITQATIAICFSSFAFHSVHLIHTTIRNQSFEEYADILVVNQTTTKQFGHGPSKSSSIIGDTHVTSIMPNRSFVPWREENNNPLPCIIDLQEGPDFNPLGHVISNQPSNEGLLFVKIEKAASTTISSVAARIAHALAHRVDANVTRPEDGLKVSKICKTRLSHLWSKRTEKLSKRDKDKSFLWTFLKDPTKRLLSIYFFFIIDLKKNHYSEEHLIEWLRYETARNPGGQLREIADRLHEVNLTDFSDEEIDLYIQKTIDNMNFIGLVERMNESLVLLQLMLDLHPSDVAIVASSKMAGDYMIFDADKKAGCQRLGYKRDIFPGVQNFLKSDEWKQLTKIEYMLYDAVNRSIDQTIETVIGRDRFDTALKKFEEVQHQVTEHCSGKIVLDCTANGTIIPLKKRSKCYKKGGIGCGHECLDEIYPLE